MITKFITGLQNKDLAKQLAALDYISIPQVLERAEKIMAVDSYRPTSFESSSKNQNDFSFKNKFDKNSDAKGRGD